jgi:capsid protein
MSLRAWLTRWLLSPLIGRRQYYTSAGSYGPPRVAQRASQIDFDREVAQDRDLAIGRCEQAYYNNGLYRGVVRNRRTRTLGAELRCRAAIRAESVPGLAAEEIKRLNREITRRYREWADSGECDASGLCRPLGTLQGLAMIDSEVRGACLVHVVYRPQNRTVPIAIELISGRRMRRPVGQMADPGVTPPPAALVNESGVEFADVEHTRVVAYWAMVRDGYTELTYRFRRFSADRCRLLLTEQLVGVENAFPRDCAAIRPLHNLSQMNQEMLEAARALAKSPMTISTDGTVRPAEIIAALSTGTDEVQPGIEPREQAVNDIDGLYTQVLPAGATAERHSASLPAPDYPGFTRVQMRAAAAAADVSYARLSREPDGSYSSGRQAEQNDQPQIETDRRNFCAVVMGLVWREFVAALWAYDLVPMPGFADYRDAYSTFDYTPPPMPSINPVDDVTAARSRREAGLTSESEEVEAAGDSYDETLERQAADYVARRQTERAYGLPPLTLEPKNRQGALTTDPTPAAGGDPASDPQVIQESGGDPQVTVPGPAD